MQWEVAFPEVGGSFARECPDIEPRIRGEATTFQCHYWYEQYL